MLLADDFLFIRLTIDLRPVIPSRVSQLREWNPCPFVDVWSVVRFRQQNLNRTYGGPLHQIK
jgi:hypothetical protein